MSYTVLRVTPHGIVLVEGHLRRLGASDGALREIVGQWARAARPGVWSLSLQGGMLSTIERGGPRLVDGMPARIARSPRVPGSGLIPKPASPSAYDAIRAVGIATLLTDPDGTEVWEACSAAVVFEQDGDLIVVPDDRPRIASIAEEALRTAMPTRTAPVRPGQGTPIALINAVSGVCSVRLDGMTNVSDALRSRMQAVIDATVGWP